MPGTVLAVWCALRRICKRANFILFFENMPILLRGVIPGCRGGEALLLISGIT